MSDEFDAIAPIRETILFGGVSYVLAPLTIAQLPPAARALRALGPQRLADAFGGDGQQLLDILAEHGEELVNLLAVASGIPVGKIGAAGPDEFVELAAAVIKVNTDFFTQRLAPAIRALESRGVGLTPSSP